MAMFAIACRFAIPGTCRVSLLSPVHYAKRAHSLERTDSKFLRLDEIKACILLCIYKMTESKNWGTITNVAKLAKMAELYHISHIDNSISEHHRTCDAEEWMSIWWAIYTLDTICSAIS